MGRGPNNLTDDLLLFLPHGNEVLTNLLRSMQVCVIDANTKEGKREEEEKESKENVIFASREISRREREPFLFRREVASRRSSTLGIDGRRSICKAFQKMRV